MADAPLFGPDDQVDDIEALLRELDEPDLEIEAGCGLVLSIEVNHQCRPFSCLQPIITAMSVWNRRVAARHPHVCVHSTHIPRQDGNRLTTRTTWKHGAKSPFASSRR